jgi:hypothetical protein
VRESVADYDFVWPTIMMQPVAEPRGADERERLGETELHVRGYNVSPGNDRNSRWRTLQRIIDNREMPLREVANTIASHCRSRRRQFNGETKFARALAEWEFDLARLKTTYYDGHQYPFHWPSAR